MSYMSDDIIAGVLFFFPEDKCLTGNRVEIHKTLFDIQKEGHSLLKPFVFSTKGIAPVSPVLQGTLARLSLGRILALYDPEFPKFEIRSEARKYIEKKILNRFTEEEQEELKLIAKGLAKKCGEEV